MDVILIAGLWLPASVWDEVAEALEAAGHRPIPVRLPGVDDRATDATLADQLLAVLVEVDAADMPLVVGHSAAATLAWLAADRRPEAITGVVTIGGFPGASGSPYADFFPAVDGLMAFPGWEPFDGPDSADLDHDARTRFEDLAIPVPAGVSTAPVELHDERRLRVPVTVVCPEFAPDDVRSWIAAGELPELERADQVRFVDIDSGHWPMLTRPVDLAALLSAAASTPPSPTAVETTRRSR